MNCTFSIGTIVFIWLAGVKGLSAIEASATPLRGIAAQATSASERASLRNIGCPPLAKGPRLSAPAATRYSIGQCTSVWRARLIAQRYLTAHEWAMNVRWRCDIVLIRQQLSTPRS